MEVVERRSRRPGGERGAGREGPPGTGEDQEASRVVGLQVGAERLQLVVQLEVEGGELVGPVEGDGDETVERGVALDRDPLVAHEIGRASCRERVCQYV